MKADRMKRLAACVAAVMMISLAGCAETGSRSSGSADGSKNSQTAAVVTAAEAGIEADDIEVGYEETDSSQIAFTDSEVQINGSGAAADGTTVTISAAGTYIISGSCANGRIVVDAGDEDKVKLVLDGIDLTCNDNAAILVNNADKVFLLLEDGTENTLTDGSSYDIAEDDNTDAAVFSRADLTINGDGLLTVNANYKHGIVSKDDLVVTGGSVTVNAVNSALVGKDSIKISAGTFDLTSGTDAVKTTNDEEGKGIISITGGSFTVNAGGDGIYAKTDLQISGGEFDMTTGGGSANASMKSDGTPNGDWQNGFGGQVGMRGEMNGEFGGEMGGEMGTPPDGFGGGMGEMPEGGMQDIPVDAETPAEQSQTDETSSDAETSDTSATSAKGLKAGGNIIIEDGTVNIDSADDSLHCDGAAHISGGSFTASSGDDGMHVGGDLVIDGGSINITKSYEGIEGMTVTVNGGDINVTASDDGINCAGGSDTGSETRMGRDQFAAQEGVFLRITGGDLNVNSGGDGLDSNGDLYIEGGTIYVSGPENGGNGSIDHNGSASITGGTVIASGAVGMEEMFDENGTAQCAVLHDFTQSFSADTEFTVTDSDGNVILSFTNPKTWQGVIFSSPELIQGESYTVSAGGESETITLGSVITSNGSGGFGGGMGGVQGGRLNF